MTKMKSKDRYVIEDGIPTIRPLHPVSKLPMGTEKEIQKAWNDFVMARSKWTPVIRSMDDLPDVDHSISYRKALRDLMSPVEHDPSYK